MNKYAVTRLARASIIESFDAMDPTRSHEVLPSQRIAAERASSRLMRTAFTTMAGIAALVVACGAMQ
ncbi:hypothetical protein [Lysobacter olei]